MHPGSPGPSASSHTAGCGNLLGTNRLEKPWTHHRPLSLVWENIDSKLSRCPDPVTPQRCHPGHQLTRARLSPFLSWRLCSPVRGQRASAHTRPATESSSLVSRTPRWERAVSGSSAGRARRTAGVPVHTRTRATLPPTPPRTTRARADDPGYGLHAGRVLALQRVHSRPAPVPTNRKSRQHFHSCTPALQINAYPRRPLEHPGSRRGWARRAGGPEGRQATQHCPCRPHCSPTWT